MAEDTQRNHFLLTLTNGHTTHRADDVVLDVKEFGDDVVGADAGEFLDGLVNEVSKDTSNTSDAPKVFIDLVAHPFLGDFLDGGFVIVTAGTGEDHRCKQDGEYQGCDEPRRAAFLLGLLDVGDTRRSLGRNLAGSHGGFVRLTCWRLVFGCACCSLGCFKFGTLQHGGQFGYISCLFPVGHPRSPHFTFGGYSLL